MVGGSRNDSIIVRIIPDGRRAPHVRGGSNFCAGDRNKKPRPRGLLGLEAWPFSNELNGVAIVTDDEIVVFLDDTEDAPRWVRFFRAMKVPPTSTQR
jgi:hypothetical protein